MPVDELSSEQRLRERCVLLAVGSQDLGGSAERVCESAEALFQYVMSGAKSPPALPASIADAVRQALADIRKQQLNGED